MAGSAETYRTYNGPALFARGFRPFFLGAGLFAAIAIPLWLSQAQSAGQFDALAWHSHEMVFGYISAVLTGFLLTAIPNWTGRLPVTGWPLAALFALWVAGRLAPLVAESVGPAALALEASFLVLLSIIAWREVLTGNNRRNIPICGLVSFFALANILFYLEPVLGLPPGIAIRAAIAVIAILIALVGGRIIPSFTRNWLAKRNPSVLPAPFGRFDIASLAVTAVALLLWVAQPAAFGSAVALLAAALLHLARLARWQGWRTVGEPLVLVLHVGYAWLPVSLGLLAFNTGALAVFWPVSGLHALTAGTIGMMTVAVMTRAILGHTGRELTAGMGTVAIYVLIFLGAALRVIALTLPFDVTAGLHIAGTLWAGGFLLFVVLYGPLLVAGTKSVP